MAKVRFMFTPNSKSKKGRYLAKDLGNINKKQRKLAILLSILLVASLILNIYQHLH